MSGKDNDKLLRVTVHGQLTEDTSTAKSEHQIYHYHVNILKQGQTQQLDYNSKLYIYKPAEKQIKQNEQVSIASIPDEDAETFNKPGERQTRHDKEDSTPSIPGKNDEVIDHKNLPDTSLISEQIKDKPALPKWPIKIPAFKIPVFNLAPLRQCLVMIKNRLIAPLKWITGSIIHFDRRFSIPELKRSPSRNIFVTTNKRSIGKRYLPYIMVMTLTMLIYYLSPETQSDIPLSHESTPPRPEKVANTRPDYHAVIKQDTDGVTITIQGPEHEEVLTKLPPGYHPVVVGNKIIHVVTKGNTLWFIAKRYIKNPYRYPELVRLNNIKNPDLIYPGDRVIIQYVQKP